MRGIEGIDEALSRLRRMASLSGVTSASMFQIFNPKAASAIKVTRGAHAKPAHRRSVRRTWRDAQVADFAAILVNNVKLGIADELAREVAHKVCARVRLCARLRACACTHVYAAGCA